MRLCRSTLLIVTCVTYLGVTSSPGTTGTRVLMPILPSAAGSLDVAQATPATGEQPTLRSGSQGAAVTKLQTQLQQLGYYKGAVDGKYGDSTKAAVSEFQKALGLEADGVAGSTTLNSLQVQVEAAEEAKKNPPTPSSTPEPTTAAPSARWNWVKWSLLLVGALGVAGGLFYLLQQFRKGKRKEPEVSLETSRSEADTTPQDFDANSDNHHLELGNNGQNSNVTSHTEIVETISLQTTPKEATAQPVTDGLPVEPTTRLAKINIIDELIKELRSPDPTKRRKVIWELGQQGDSRAVQPLIDLMIESDSQQCSLILAALSEIGTRTLKPMNRALAMSLQDENAEVRKNAIRDLTRIYDQMAQISQLLCCAIEDPDAEVQETARYALAQMNRIRALPAREEQGE